MRGTLMAVKKKYSARCVFCEVQSFSFQFQKVQKRAVIKGWGPEIFPRGYYERDPAYFSRKIEEK